MYRTLLTPGSDSFLMKTGDVNRYTNAEGDCGRKFELYNT